MFNSAIMDVGIGLVIVFLICSTICSTIRESIAQLLKERQEGLFRGIRSMLGASSGGKSPDIADQVIGHPLVKGMGQGKHRGPSYLSGRTFSLALMDVLTPDGVTSTSVAELRSAVVATQNQVLQDTLLPLFDAAGADLTKLRRLVSQHYDELMARVSGWYRRPTQLWVFLTAAVVAGAGNIDTIQIASSLYREPVVRAQTVAVAAELVKRSPPAAGQSAYEDSLESLKSLSLPIGWTAPPSDFNAWIHKIAGLLITVLAVLLGAPFWFDLLSKVSTLRASGPRPPTSNEITANSTAKVEVS
jgi:hypothetical protein